MSSTRGNIEELFESLEERRDRRGYSRSNSPLLTYIDLGDGNGGIALNISEGGVAITAAETMFADYFPTIRFQLPKVPGWIETSGQLVWISDSKKGAGIRFDGITEVDRERIRHWISSRASAGEEIEEGIGYLFENKEQSSAMPGLGRVQKPPRKLEVLSEADEARFAAMFPSESSLQRPPEHKWLETEVEREVEQRVGQCSPEDAWEEFPRPDSNGGNLSAQRIGEHSVEDAEVPSQSIGADFVPNSRDVESLSGPSLAGAIAIEHEVSPLETPDATLDHKESLQTDDKTPAEWTLPTFAYPEETDWRQQFDRNRGRLETELSRQQASGTTPEHSKAALIVGVGILIAAICFAAGLTLGNGTLRKLLKLDGGAAVAGSSSAASPETNSGNSNESSETPTPQAKNNSSSASRDASSNDLVQNSNATTPAPPGPSASTTDVTESRRPSDDQKAPATNDARQNSNTRQEIERAAPPSDRSSSNDSAAIAKNSSSQVPAAPAAPPETETRQPSETKASPQNYSDATADRPFSEVQRPILVTLPDEKSGPFRLAFPEVALSASRSLAISAQRFVLVPVQPGPASGHRPERLQAGVLIYRVDPVRSAAESDTGGTVKVRATIGKAGDVVDVKAISGPISLIPRVVRAVREWRYTVTLLDGQPLGAEEDVVVVFRPRG